MYRLSMQHTLLPFILVLAACGSPQADASAPNASADVRLELVASDLAQPTSVVNAGDGSGRLFVTQQTGLIRVVENGAPLEIPFLDLSSAVSTGGERGLLGLAFHPNYAQNGRFFVNYTDTGGNTVIAEFAVSDDPNVADPASEQVLLTLEQPYPNHNGGNLVFGPDDFLYIGTGDGGAGGDPEENGQDTNALLGKMLRIDVDNAPEGAAYGVPESNPFVGGGAEPEVWAYGLRNPWRFSFDRQTGDLWIADVGQNRIEEVNRQPAASAGGENYGWNRTEGSSCFDPADPMNASEDCDTSGLTLPVLEYSHDEGQSITGGYVYRGEGVPALQGHYIYGDFTSQTIWSAAAEGEDAETTYSSTPLMDAGFNVVAFGEDEAGELYVADYGGTLYRFAPAAQAAK